MLRDVPIQTSPTIKRQRSETPALTIFQPDRTACLRCTISKRPVLHPQFHFHTSLGSVGFYLPEEPANLSSPPRGQLSGSRRRGVPRCKSTKRQHSQCNVPRGHQNLPLSKCETQDPHAGIRSRRCHDQKTTSQRRESQVRTQAPRGQQPYWLEAGHLNPARKNFE